MDERIFKSDYMELLFGEIIKEDLDREIAEVEAMPPFEFSENFERRIKKLFAKERRKEAVKMSFVALKYAAAVMTVLFAGLSAIILTFSPNVRAAVKDTFVTWYGKFTQFDPKSSEEEFISGLKFKPSFVPEGYIEEKITETLSVYSKSDEEIIIFDYAPIDATTSVNNDDVEYKLITENGIDYHTFTAIENGKFNSITWENKGYRFSLDGYLDVSVLLEIAKSVAQS